MKIIKNIFFKNDDFQSKNTVVKVICDYSSFDIPLYSEFEYLEIGHSKTAFSTPVILEEVTQQFGAPFDSVPIGWATICTFRIFTGNDLELFTGLNFIDNRERKMADVRLGCDHILFYINVLYIIGYKDCK